MRDGETVSKNKALAEVLKARQKHRQFGWGRVSRGQGGGKKAGEGEVEAGWQGKGR